MIADGKVWVSSCFCVLINTHGSNTHETSFCLINILSIYSYLNEGKNCKPLGHRGRTHPLVPSSLQKEVSDLDVL